MSNLFTPVRIGAIDLSHRVAMAPLTRMRADLPGNIPNALMAEYYGQRASRGGLIISEATFIDPRGYGAAGSPGIFTLEQVAGWRRVTDAVHAKGAKMLLQLWHVGRQSHTSLQPDGAAPLAPSAIQAEGARSLLVDGPAPTSMPRALELGEIAEIVGQYRRGAELARQAGFDGAEIHAANGYLIDQFLQDNSNKRTDIYGGGIENRARFLLEVVEAVTSVWGGDRVGIRIAPSGAFGDMGDSDPQATFAYVAEALNRFGLAYLHVIEPRMKGGMPIDESQPAVATATLRPIFKGPIIAAGGFTGESAEEIVAKGDADLVSFGRFYIANPDLPERLRHKQPLTPYVRDTFYYGGEAGYTDYPFHDETSAAA